MNGRKRKWKGRQGEEKGTDFQIKFSGHLNKHLSQQSSGQGDGGRDVCELGNVGVFQQDTSNKQRLKKHACSPSQGFSSEMPQLHSHRVSGLAGSLQAFPVMFCSPARVILGWGTLATAMGFLLSSSLVSGVEKSGSPGPSSLEEQRRRQSHLVTPHRVLPPLLLPFKNKRAKGRAEIAEPLKIKMKAHQ